MGAVKSPSMKRLPLSIALVSISLGILAQPTAHPFEPQDWASLHSANVHAVSTDGHWVLHTVTWGADKGDGTVEWRLVHPDGAGSLKLELPEGFNPEGFTAEGNLYGRQMVKGAMSVVVYPVEGLKGTSPPTTAISIPGAIRAITISPDGKKFGVLANPMPPDPLDGVHTVIQADHASLYVVGVDGSGGQWWSPELKDVVSFAWSRDSGAIAAVSMTPKIGFHYMRSWIDVCSSTSTVHVATIDNSVNGVAWSGDEIVFSSTTTSVLTPDHLWTVAASGKEKPVDRTPDLVGSVMNVYADPHGKAWVQVDRGVQNEIDVFANDKLALAYKWPDGYVGNILYPQVATGPDQLAFDVGDPRHAPNLAVPSEGTGLRRITTEGDSQLAGVSLGEAKIVHWTSKEGTPLEGIATFPPGFQPGKRYPFVVYPHGGPEGNDLLSLDTFPQILSGMGYVVMQPEYRGSTGYGTDFLNSIYQHFGDRAYRDVDSATDFAIAQGWADPKRLAIFGWSAGGFMTSWTVTQTDRYKAAIEGAGITDWGSFMWTSDLPQFDYDARLPAKDPNAFAKFSAVMYADRVTTPLLILHGAADARVPTYQGREYFETLLALGKTTRMVTYPGSGHFPNRWDQIIDVANELEAWLKKYDP